MRKVRAVVFVVAGILLAVVFLDVFVFHVAYGDTTQYVYMALSAAGSIACFAVGLADWRPDRRSDFGDRQPSVPNSRAAVLSVVGTLLGLAAAFGYRSAPWPAFALGFFAFLV